MRRPGGIVGSAIDRLEEATGMTAVSSERLGLLENAYVDYRAQTREMEDVGWQILDYVSGQPQELRVESRLRVVQRARYVWMNDPQAGAAVELMNDFCFGRGIPGPRCKDKQVQEVVDEAWNDPDNQEVLTSLEAQLALGTDLALQSNVFLLMFDDGADGRVKLSILRHDDVRDAIPDPDKRHRLLWYVTRRPAQQSYDFANGVWNVATYQDALQMKPLYYAHWRNVELALEEARTGARVEDVPMPPPELAADGLVYHARINRYSEMKFGAPRFQRTLRWYTAYNDFVKARIDVAQAAAAYIMKRKVRASPTQLARDAAKMVSRTSLLAQGATPETAPMAPPRPGSILEENESVSHEALNLGSSAGQAQEDANIIRAPISASERFSQAYFGDASNSNLATATSLELPILKAVEARQEVFEGIFRWFLDRVIERGVETGNIPEELAADERADKQPEQELDVPVDEVPLPAQQALYEAAEFEVKAGRQIVEVSRVGNVAGRVWLVVSADAAGYHYRLAEYEDQITDEQDTARDLSYEFSMPSPLRRMMTDLIAGVTQIAQTFDPNNTNAAMSRTLLTIALAEGFEVQDAAALVDEIFPKGYMDPMVAAQLQSAMAPPAPAPGQGEIATDPTQQMPGGGDGNVYGAPMNSAAPEDRRGSGTYSMQQATVVEIRDRKGNVREFPVRRRRTLEEAAARLDEPKRVLVDAAAADAKEDFDRDVSNDALRRLDSVRVTGEDEPPTAA